jgi:Flp pilus assembly protein TadB
MLEQSANGQRRGADPDLQSGRNVGAVALVILLGLVVGTAGLVAADLYTVGVLILLVGGVGAAVLVGEYLIRYASSRRPPA